MDRGGAPLGSGSSSWSSCRKPGSCGARPPAPVRPARPRPFLRPFPERLCSPSRLTRTPRGLEPDGSLTRTRRSSWASPDSERRQHPPGHRLWPVVETWLCRACVQALLLRDPGFLRAPGSLTSPGASRNPRKPQPVGRPASALTPPGVLPSGHLTRTFHAARSLPWSLPFTAKAQAEASAGGAAPGGAGRGRTWAGQGWKVQEGLPRLSVTLVAPTWPLALQAVPVSLRVTPISLQAMSCLSCVTTWFPERGLPGS